MNDTTKIYDALTFHHYAVRDFGYKPVMTVLVGSQNYGLATENSDYDTFTFVLPNLMGVATLKDPVSTTREDKFGHINIKDIRLGLNLLKKTSPNSVECFASKYYITEPDFLETIELIRRPMFLRCNTHHMMMAIGGIAHQLMKRNMPPGKRFSHLLRMYCMIENYFDLDSDILSMSDTMREKALIAKADPDNPKWDEECGKWDKIIHDKISTLDLDYFKSHECELESAIDAIQLLILKRTFTTSGE